MLPVLSVETFIGTIKISTNTFTQEKFEDLINELYPLYVIKTLGEAAYADILNSTQEKYEDLFNGGIYTINGTYHQNTGLLYAYRRMIYYEAMREGHLSTIAGNVRSNQENSIRLTPEQDTARGGSRWFEAYRCLAGSVNDFLKNYENYEVSIDSISAIGGDNYTLFVSDTRYLKDGDTVYIEGVPFVISNLVIDTSFDVISESFLVADKVVYKPFELIKFYFEIGQII